MRAIQGAFGGERQVETIDRVHDRHIEWCSGRAFLEAVDVEIDVVLSPIGETVDEVGIAMVGEDVGSIGREQAVERFVRQAMRMHQTALAQQTFDRQTQLLRHDVVAQTSVDTARRNLDAAKQIGARAAEERARLQLESNIGGENTAVAQVRQQLAAGENDLAKTKVAAPCDGFVSSVNILPGQIVSAGVVVMPFICDVEDNDRGKVVATFQQGAWLGVKGRRSGRGDIPDVSGLVFTAKVVDTIDVTSGDQVPVGGIIPDILSSGAPRFAAILKLDDPNLRLPAGARGEGAVCSDKVPFAAMFRKGLIRTDTIINYLRWGT